MSNQSKPGAAQIASLIRNEIRNEQWQKYDRLPAERSLADTYGVARGTVRDALTMLSDQKFVEIRPGSGTYVSFSGNESDTEAIENATPLELIDTRFALEPHICRLVVMHSRRNDFDRLEMLCDRMEASADDAIVFAETDSEFHRALAESTRNGLLIWIIDQITSVRSQQDWMRMRKLTLDKNVIRQYNDQHRRLLNAMRIREPELAAKIMKEHLETARLSLTRAADT